jgi:hypothetical protein
MAEPRDFQRPLWTPAVIAAFVLGLALLGVVMWFSLVGIGLGPCGGDGGSPYAAPASPRGSFCEHGGLVVPLWTVPLWAPFIGLVAGLVAAQRTRHRTYLATGIVAAMMIAAAPVVISLVLPARCASDDPRVNSAACDHY